MIAACPKCSARYRIEREKVGADGVRLRCQRCEAVFRVRPPAMVPAPVVAGPAPAQAEATPPFLVPAAAATESSSPSAVAASEASSRPRVLVAAPEAEAAKLAAAILERRGLEALVVHDGVEAMLEIQRKLPRAAVLWASLPRMFGYQICEIVKRNESLRTIGIVLVGEIHDSARHRRPANDLYGADCYIEEPDVPDGLPALLEGLGVPLVPPPAAQPVRVAPPVAPAPVAPPALAPTVTAPTVTAATVTKPPLTKPPAAVPASRGDAAPRGDGLDEQRAQALRLARIIVSDIVLYNEAKFTGAVRRGNVLTALEGELAEGRSLFRERIDERVRSERDHLAEELLRVARSRGMAG